MRTAVIRSAGMRTAVTRIGVTLSLVLFLATAAIGGGEIDERALVAHREFLDSPDLGSRRAGEDGLLPASRYLAVELRRLGYSGGGQSGS